ncbi:hypothetical protein EDB95_1405 [Dinghuibacter silviterrae]|uniref:Uncharacterized protein n=1 Tax=Dinghuibacter silviterrae TaxID=1539049 RepID=A0A4V3GLP6_9BACT|nr:hypothetical protein EDB95_1405 [Dinghuibacter silviterrae]
MKIKNISGTSELDCVCGSWLKHWENFSGKTATYCGEQYCTETKNLVGAHVRRVDISDSNRYILPLCAKHNKSKEELEVFSKYTLVSANTGETCEK